MGFLHAFLVLLVAALLAAFLLLVLGSIYFDYANSEIPPGVEHPARLRIIHATLIGASVLVSGSQRPIQRRGCNLRETHELHRLPIRHAPLRSPPDFNLLLSDIANGKVGAPLSERERSNERRIIGQEEGKGKERAWQCLKTQPRKVWLWC